MIVSICVVCRIWMSQSSLRFTASTFACVIVCKIASALLAQLTVTLLSRGDVGRVDPPISDEEKVE